MSNKVKFSVIFYNRTTRPDYFIGRGRTNTNFPIYEVLTKDELRARVGGSFVNDIIGMEA